MHLPAAQVNWRVASPPDISMDITKLTQILGIKPISFQDGVRSTLDAEASTWHFLNSLLEFLGSCLHSNMKVWHRKSHLICGILVTVDVCWIYVKYVTLYLLNTNGIIGVTTWLYCTVMNKNDIHFKSFFPEVCNCIVHVYYNLQLMLPSCIF